MRIKKKKLIIAILLITIILLILFTTTVFAEFISIIKSSKTLKIATPIFIVEGTETAKISEINNIGYYEFKVKNYNGNKVSEIGFKYTIEIVADTDNSVKFELYKGDEKIELENLKTQEFTIDANKQNTDEYKLKVTYDKLLGTKGKDILEEVQVKVHSEQIG